MTENKVGRPLKYKSVDDIIPLIDKYFQDTPKKEWTITGLALALDTSRATLIHYCNKAENGDIDREFLNTIKKAKDYVEHSYELDLKEKGNTGTIFALKNFDWKDKQEIDQTTKQYSFTAEDLKNMSDEELIELQSKME